MAKRLRNAVAVAAVSLLCLPFGGCGGVVASENPDGLNNIAPEGSAAVDYGGAQAPATEHVYSQSEVGAPLPADETGDHEIPVEPPKSEKYDGAYIWDGDLVAAGWGDTAENKTPAPDGYVLLETDRTLSIQNAAAFAYFAHESSLAENDGFKDYTVNLDCDIDLGGDANLWIPAALTSRKHAADETDGKSVMFKGVFNGNGHTIYNLSSKRFYDGLRYDGSAASVYASETLSVPLTTDSGEYLYGLFAAAGNAEFKNLKVADIHIDLPAKQVNGFNFITDCVGAVLSYALGDVTIKDITVGSDGSESGKGSGNDVIRNTACTGGIVGRVYAGKINGKPAGRIDPASGTKFLPSGYRLGEVRAENCTSYVDLGTDGEGDKKGGIVGYVVYHAIGIFDNCVNYGNINGVFAGGITSYFQIAGNVYYYEDAPDAPINYTYTFENCVNHGNITAKLSNPADGSWIGGIIGAINDFASEENALYNKTLGFYECFNYGTITTHQLKVAGGIIGRFDSSANANAANKYSLEFNRVFNYGDIAGYNGDRTGADIAAGGVIGALIKLPEGQKENIVIAVGNCGAVTGKVAGGVIGKGDEQLSKCTVKYLIDAYKQN